MIRESESECCSAWCLFFKKMISLFQSLPCLSFPTVCSIHLLAPLKYSKPCVKSFVIYRFIWDMFSQFLWQHSQMNPFASCCFCCLSFFFFSGLAINNRVEFSYLDSSVMCKSSMGRFCFILLRLNVKCTLEKYTCDVFFFLFQIYYCSICWFAI